MSVYRRVLVIALLLLLGVGCGVSGKSGESAADQTKTPDGKSAGAPGPMLKISTYDHAGFCDLACGADGALHAVFDDQVSPMTGRYLYYTASKDDGKTWSKPLNLSDDESGNAATFARVMVDRAGRVYVIWKYVDRNTILEGPGGYTGGILVYRVLEGGTWSKRQILGDAKVASFSWFTCLDPNGAVQVVWSQMTVQDAALTSPYLNYANLVRQSRLDGAVATPPTDLIAPKPLLTPAEVETMRAAGQYPPYTETVPRRQGIINLRGFVTANGVAIFVGEDAGVIDANGRDGGRRVVHWDGKALRQLHEFDRIGTFNNFNNPPGLIADAAGRQHLLRAPENAATPCVRDYLVQDGELGEPVTVIAPPDEKGRILNWQTHQLPNGWMAVTATISKKGGYSSDDNELYITYSNGDGTWSEPVCLTENATATAFFTKETTTTSRVSTLEERSPTFAAVAVTPGGGVRVLTVIDANTLLSISHTGVTSGGTAVQFSTGGRISAPAVYFRTVPPAPFATGK